MAGMRAFAFVCAGLALAGCKKHPTEDDPPPAAGSGHTSGHAKLKDVPAEASGSSAPVAVAVDAAVDADKTKKGAFRDDDGHIHGPGGPVFMGNSAVPCDRDHDHCLRPDVWFQVHNIETGGAYRATPVFSFENKWWAWNMGTEPIDPDGQLYKTKPAASMPSPGTKLIYFHGDPEDGSLLPTTEEEALTASAWQAGVVEKVKGTTITISGVGDIPLDEARVITETRGF